MTKADNLKLLGITFIEKTANRKMFYIELSSPSTSIFHLQKEVRQISVCKSDFPREKKIITQRFNFSTSELRSLNPKRLSSAHSKNSSLQNTTPGSLVFNAFLQIRLPIFRSTIFRRKHQNRGR